jgi:hypothetical protein
VPGGTPFATIQVMPFGGLTPRAGDGNYLGDQFVINGRPFSGTGFGFDLTNCANLNTTIPVPTPKSAPYDPPAAPGVYGPLLTAAETVTGLPYALLPNHAQIQLTSSTTATAPYYSDPSGPGGANESYDAVDPQNMLLAMHVPSLLAGGGGTITPIPSLHRPELIAWYPQQGKLLVNPALYLSGTNANLPLRRKVILRPEPMDQANTSWTDLNGNGVFDYREPWMDVDNDGLFTPQPSGMDVYIDLNGDNNYTSGDLDFTGKLFNPITGAYYVDANGIWRPDPTIPAIYKADWDVDNDNDGTNDSIWVDIGLPVQTRPDGTKVKTLVAYLCVDMDGKLNLNAGGTIAQLDPDRYTNSANTALMGAGATGTGTINAPAAGTTTGQLFALSANSQRTAPIGQGYGTAEINPAYLLSRAVSTVPGEVDPQTLNYMAYLMMGYAYVEVDTTTTPWTYTFYSSVDGKYGESARYYYPSNPSLPYPGLLAPSPYTSPVGINPTWLPAYALPGMKYTAYLTGGPRPGWSRWIDPLATNVTYTSTLFNPSGVGYDWVNDRMTLARMSDYRPFLLNPFAQLQSVYSQQGIFFDFIGQSLTAYSPPVSPGSSPSANPLVHLPTAHGTPYDLNARGVLVTDFRGLPVYAGTATLPWMMSANAAGTLSPGAVDPALPTPATTPPAPYPAPQSANPVYDAMISAVNDAVDIPYELDLTATARIVGTDTGNNNMVTTIDNPYTPNELEGMLRVNDIDAKGYRKRLDELQGIYKAEGQTTATPVYPWPHPGPGLPPTPPTPETSVLTDLRLSLTTESWDLPVPSVTLTPSQMRDIAAFNAKYAPTGPQLNYNNLSVADLMRARIFADNAGYTTPNAADEALFGNLLNNSTTFPAKAVWPLLAPEVVMGLRMDINRLLGNGQDDNGNGVVDEPAEVLLGESMLFPASNISPVNLPGSSLTSVALDHNNDGFWAALSTLSGLDTTNADLRARQLLAKQLYVLMMLLVDDRTIVANAHKFVTNGQQLPWNNIPANSPQQAAYVVAQWAINVVDFRDRDSIMTPFEFDIYPFLDNDGSVDLGTGLPYGTWDVDDIVGPLGAPSPDDLLPYRGLVWGCERPELLITETIATHDRGTDDTDKGEPPAGGSDSYTNDATATMKDPDYDQVRRPRGSLIFELFNCTNPSDAPQRDLQYDPNLAAAGQLPWQTPDLNSAAIATAFGAGGGYVGPGYGVNLAQVATGPVVGSGPASSPVWRVVIAYSPNYDESAFYTNPGGPTVTNNVQSPALDPRAPILPAKYIHRAAYFAPYQAAFMTGGGTMMNEILSGRSFFLDPGVFPNSTNGALMLPPSYYAVVGPAAPDASGINAIYLGLNTKDATPNNNPLKMVLGNQTLYNTMVSMVDNSGAATAGYAGVGTAFKPVIGVPIQTTWLQTGAGGYTYLPRGGANPAMTLRMSVSEPETGYPLWPATTGSTWDDASYYSSTPPATPAGGVPNFPTRPFDSGQSSYVASTPNYYVAPSGSDNDPTMTPAYTVIYLQRLANPLMPWDGAANPYITVDSMPVDLISYTGENQGLSDATKAAQNEPAYTNPNPATNTIKAFTTRRRGYDPTNGSQTLNTAQGAPNCWTPLPLSSTVYTAGQFGISANNGSLTTPLPSTGTNYATLGFLNTEYGYGTSNYTNASGANPAPVGSSGVNANVYMGDPSTPFPWITWNNRPYVSQYELMLVPASSPSSLTSDFGMLGNTSGGAAINEFYPTDPATAGQLPFAQFRHLLNFFNSEQTGGTNLMANFHRIFEYVHVPSRFAGTQTMLHPNVFSPAGGLPHMFHPPFNWLSRYREPGKVNLNTVFDPQVFEGVMDAYPGWNTAWSNVLNGRQGFVPTTPLNLFTPLPNPVAGAIAGYPTSFANPFRPGGAGALVPPTNLAAPKSNVGQLMMHQWGYPGTTTNDYGINTTLLRANGINANPANGAAMGTATTALFDDTSFDPNNTSATYSYSSNTNTPYRHAGRNAYFQYQAYQKLGNLVTNRSNVYALWITLGKFEVQQVPISTRNPDGYELVQELGTATGEIERQRGFYLIDRSIPVGFSRGQNLNVERTLLIERILDD